MPSFPAPVLAEGVKMTYTIGDGSVFEFSPVPFIQCDTAFDLSGKEETGQTITINVNGTLVAPKHLYNEGMRIQDTRHDYEVNFGGNGENAKYE
jgi:hypothetical protein